MNDDDLELGPCCICRTRSATGVAMLHVRAPVPGTGWGCLVCALPNDGAVAVLCDACGASDAPILDVCHGYPREARRIALSACTEPFAHDDKLHAACESAARASV